MIDNGGEPGWLATATATVAVAVSAWAWKHTHGLIGTKAEMKTVESLVMRFEQTAQQQREDNQRIFDKIEEVTDAFHMHVEKIAEELGKRPTRDECNMIVHRSISPR